MTNNEELTPPLTGELGEEVFEELIQIKNSMDRLEAREKEIKALLVEKMTGNVTFGQYQVQKITSNKVVLKKGITIVDVKQKFGDQYIKYSVDMEELKGNPDAHEMLELQPTTFIKVIKNKDVPQS